MSERHNRLELLCVLPDRAADGHLMGRWKCDCGKQTDVQIARVRKGYTKSCGCLASELTGYRATTHGMRNSAEYSSWSAMKRRCRDVGSKDFQRYGAKGITLCDEWAESFERFYEHVGPRPKGTSIDRIDNSKGYEPGNVRWANAVEQARNKSRFVVVTTDKYGEIPLVDYAKLLGITRGAAHLRLKRGKLEGVHK